MDLSDYKSKEEHFLKEKWSNYGGWGIGRIQSEIWQTLIQSPWQESVVSFVFPLCDSVPTKKEKTDLAFDCGL